ncbi:hypothetical protein M2226_003687 [Bradyrhizobium elkanii]|nr:hypothetical protein [Bradyrhizobium elkanii]MCS4069868.1 hypothetical protein [Bradyrhizobium elkanii]MCS4076499.1 hypothetical protein [Bradyrhizobium elkanii]MCW2124943.1 hypothetical protein [Bradyrhizobium elkanii]MCW2171689.1 hypothetical protein [Bradyrhizobium elkanii]
MMSRNLARRSVQAATIRPLDIQNAISAGSTGAPAVC